MIKDASLSGDKESILRNGRIGMIDNTTVYKSRNLYSATDGTTSTTCWYALFGHISAISFAAQLTKTESTRIERGFGNLVKGLEVYGYKVVTPKALGYLYADKGSE